MEKDRILFVQFSNSCFLRHGECDRYWDTFYRRWSNMGYYMGKHVFEPPKWVAEIDYFLDGKYGRELLWVEHDPQEAVDKISGGGYAYVLFSLMNANQHMIEEVVKACPQQRFLIGGYNEKFLRYLGETYSLVTICETTKDTADALGCFYRFGTSYELFKGDTVIPRLTLSYGCMNKCKFCIVPHGGVTMVPAKTVRQQVRSFSALKYRMIYIDDKTFGQATNCRDIRELRRLCADDFNGFIVQTTSGLVANSAEQFKEDGVSVAEIGLETFNDPILRAWRKPSSEATVRKAVEAADRNGLRLIANIIVGLPEETEDTYKRTFDYVMPLLEDGRLIGINPAIFTDYGSEDNLGEIDFAEDGKTEMHRKWWDKFNSTAADILERQCEERKICEFDRFW